MLNWKDKQNGVDDVLAEDINGIAHAVIRLQEDSENNGVDQTYNPESTNAQSGIAVKEAINQEVGAVDDYGRYGVQNVDGNLTISTATPNDVSQGSNVKPITPAILEYAIASKTDKTYNPDSSMPQSGKAVAEAVTEKWELLHDVVVETEVSALNLDVYSKKVHLEAVLKKPANYTSGSVSIYLQPGSYRGAMMAAAYNSTNGLMAVQGDMHIEPSGRITTMLGVEQGEYGYSSAHRRSIVTKNFATNGKIPKVQLQAPAFGVGSIIKVWGVK